MWKQFFPRHCAFSDVGLADTDRQTEREVNWRLFCTNRCTICSFCVFLGTLWSAKKVIWELAQSAISNRCAFQSFLGVQIVCSDFSTIAFVKILQSEGNMSKCSDDSNRHITISVQKVKTINVLLRWRYQLILFYHYWQYTALLSNNELRLHMLGEWERVGEAQNDKIWNLFLDEMQSK